MILQQPAYMQKVVLVDLPNANIAYVYDFLKGWFRECRGSVGALTSRSGAKSVHGTMCHPIAHGIFKQCHGPF